jgi:hypothetical protein
MRIPTGNFGNVVAQPQRQVQVQNDGAIGDALGNVGRALGGIAQDMQQAVVQKQRAEAASTLATATNEAHDDYDDISRGVDEGRIKPEEAVPELKKRLGERQGARNKELTEEQRLLIDDNIIRVSGTLERNLNGVVMKRMQADTDAAILTTGEQLQRRAMRDLPGAIKSWEAVVDAVPHWDPVKKAQVKQQFREGAAYNFADATLEGAAAKEDADLVRAAREKIQGEDGEVIDPAKRIALITKAYGYEHNIKAAAVRAAEKAAREQQARENTAVDIYNKAFDLAGQGQYFSSEFINELATTTAGTTMAGPAQKLVKSQAQSAGFASMPLVRMDAELERMRAAGADPKVGVSPIEQKVLEQYEKIRSAKATAYDENPWQAAQRYGAIKDAAVVSLTSVQEAQKTIAERMKNIGQVEADIGRKISPLQPQEAETIGRLVQSLPPDQQSSALATFAKLIGNADRLAALARQIDAKDKVLGTAMMIGDLQTTQGRYVSELVLKGARAIKDKAIMMDEHKETGWRGAIAREIGDAFPNQEVRDRMVDAAYYVQAGFAAEGGGADTSRAIRLVVGRIVERNGSKIPLPRGMEEGDFEKRISSIKPADLAAQAPGGSVFIGKTAVPIDQFVNSLPDAALVHAGSGRYNIRAGMGLVTNSQGKRITIEVR